MIVSPKTFAEHFRDAIVSDPGCERKAMLFYLDDENVEFDHFESQARCTSLHLKRRQTTPQLQSANAEKQQPNQDSPEERRHKTTIAKLSSFDELDKNH